MTLKKTELKTVIGQDALNWPLEYKHSGCFFSLGSKKSNGQDSEWTIAVNGKHSMYFLFSRSQQDQDLTAAMKKMVGDWVLWDNISGKSKIPGGRTIDEDSSGDHNQKRRQVRGWHASEKQLEINFDPVFFSEDHWRKD